LWLNWTRHRHRGLRTWVLFVLGRGPKNGAEIMDAMDAISQGLWRPSPGSIYPLLESMTEEGLVKKLSDGRYEITEQGRVETDWTSRLRGGEPTTVGDILSQLSNNVSYLEDLKKTKSSNLETHSKEIAELASRLQRLGED
jgi:DNA-binding PadR family transcriptional regulator